MLSAPVPSNEQKRLEYLRESNILDSAPELEFDDLALLAAEICQVPIAVVSLVDENRQWFKAKVGTDATESSREVAFCAHAILHEQILEVPDAQKDERFSDNPLVTAAPFLRFYAGAPLITPEGYALGTLCVIDDKPRQLTPNQSRALSILAREVVTEIRLRRTVTDLLASREQIRHDAMHDALTGLPNRLLFADRVDRCLERSKRNPKSLFAVMFLDLDGFKAVNDSFGHGAGDTMLQTIAGRLRGCMRSTDSLSRVESSVARMGGDEFTVLLDGIKHPLDVGIVAQRILQAFSEPIVFQGNTIRITTSIGVVINGCDYLNGTAIDFLRDADIAMYRAKADGGNRYVIFDSAMHQVAIAKWHRETEMRTAIESCQFFLHYQPVISLDSGRIESIEALVRWNRGGETVNPVDFLETAEDSGMILQLGRWVITEAIRQLAEWRQKEPEMRALTMSINIAGKQLNDPQLLPTIYVALATNGVPAADVILEFTEQALMQGADASQQVLEDLKLVGVGISIDDFGTAFSSLNCLHNYPIDVVKLDGKFVKNVLTHGAVSAVVRAVTELAHELGISVVAEGLETREEANDLQSLGADKGQGFYFSRPLAAASLPSFIANWNVSKAA